MNDVSQDQPFVDVRESLEGQILTNLNATWNFDLRVIARTLDNRNNADDVYTGHARTTWRWDASGTFTNNAGTYVPTGNVLAPGLWASVNGPPPYDASNPRDPFFNGRIKDSDDTGRVQ